MPKQFVIVVLIAVVVVVAVVRHRRPLSSSITLVHFPPFSSIILIYHHPYLLSSSSIIVVRHRRYLYSCHSFYHPPRSSNSVNIIILAQGKWAVSIDFPTLFYLSLVGVSSHVGAGNGVALAVERHKTSGRLKLTMPQISPRPFRELGCTYSGCGSSFPAMISHKFRTFAGANKGSGRLQDPAGVIPGCSR